VRIWVDADACPLPIKEILFRAAERVGLSLILVANRPLRTPASRFIRAIQVAKGFDIADRRIADEMRPGDLVVTADIPLAAVVIERGGHALDPRGEMYTSDNIRERLSMRNLMDELRSAGVDTGGPPAFSRADRQAFANQLDRWVAGMRIRIDKR
jgi:uncharacterized protein YaiI (UPF0178 family)